MVCPSHCSNALFILAIISSKQHSEVYTPVTPTLWVRQLNAEKLNSLPKVRQLICWGSDNQIQHSLNSIQFKKCQKLPSKGRVLFSSYSDSPGGEDTTPALHTEQKVRIKEGQGQEGQIKCPERWDAPGMGVSLGSSHHVQVGVRVGSEGNGPRSGFQGERNGAA